MRRILLIAAMLLPVTSAMAAVTITADVNAVQVMRDGVPHKTVTISFVSDVNVRAFALDIDVDNGTNIGDNAPTNFLRGESISPVIVPGKAKGYGIFPGRFRDFIDPTTPDWDDSNYMPITPWNDAPNTGLGWPSMIVELGTLWAAGSGDINRPDLTGVLFTFDVNSENQSDCNLTVAANDLRGGIVGNDAAEITDTNLPFTKKITFAAGCTVPSCVGLTRAACITLLAATTPPQTAVDHNVPGTGQPLGQVIAQSPAAAGACTGTVTIDVVSYPIKIMTTAASLYVNWQNRGRPACWAYPRQCHGDADGKKLGTYTGAPDLTIYRSAVGKVDAQLPPGGICADFDHKKLGTWVGAPDLTIYRAYVGKVDAQNPLCGGVVSPPVYPSADVNYHYWCIPTGSTCPTGQYCAPVGTCPNTP
jgi:hypothetical protein